MSRFWTANTQGLEPYTPGEQPGGRENIIKINTNECPYPPSPRVLEAIRQACGQDLRRYPNPDAQPARQAFAEANGLDVSQVFAGNGSDEVLAMAFEAFFDEQHPLYSLDITYSFYPTYAKLYQIPYYTIPLLENFQVDVEGLCGVPGAVALANPNAPTTLALSRSEIEQIVAAHPDQVVLVDEAYVDFGAESALPLLRRYDNLLVVQTLSKSRALAGMRIGFAAGSPELIAGLDRVKNSFNSYTLDRLAIAAAVAALEDQAYFREITGKIRRTRERTADALRAMGFAVLDSQTNFLFASHKRIPARELFPLLKQRGILVRYFDKPRICDYLRITIGTEEEMERFIEEMEVLCHAGSGV